MAKYRHRIFEMYDFRDEAECALTAKSARTSLGPTDSQSWTFKYLAVSHSAGLSHAWFRGALVFGEETTGVLRADFLHLSDLLPRNSRVLLNFDGVKSYCDSAVEELLKFNQKLRTKGSLIALCCLGPAVHQSFF